jgi:hypothetical protein
MSESVTGSRADVDSLIPWATRLYASGATSGDVMRAVYGVDLPAEAYAFHRDIAAGRLLPVELLDHPWDLLTLADPAQPTRKPHRWSREQEAYAYSQYPDVLPLMQLGGGATTDGVLDDHIIGYDLASLRAGATAILGHEGELRSTGARFEPLGDSLVDVLHEWMSEHLAMVTGQYESPTNFGFGSLERKDVAKVAGMLSLIEGLRTG